MGQRVDLEFAPGEGSPRKPKSIKGSLPRPSYHGPAATAESEAENDMGIGWMTAQGYLLQRDTASTQLASSPDETRPTTLAGPAERRHAILGGSSDTASTQAVRPANWWLATLLGLALGLSIAALAHGSGLDTDCDAAGLTGRYDEWAVLEYEVEPAGIRLEDLSLEGSSTWNYGSRLRQCAAAGKTPLPRKGLGTHTLFRFRPARYLDEDKRRLLDFHPSGALTQARHRLDGNLALKLEFDAHGEIRPPELLFASDPELGALVIDHLPESLKIVQAGPEAETRIDVLYLRFRQGDLVNFSQLHYIPRR